MPSPDRRVCRWSFLGSLAYRDADRLQRSLREGVRTDSGTDFLVLLEHPPVYTLGRNAEPADVLAERAWLSNRGVEICESDRGGKVTYHGPGQLVGYPIVDLSPDRRDLRRYVGDLLEVLVRTLEDLEVDAEPRGAGDEIGVWAGSRKIASLGVHVSRWITTHGFALNVTTDLSYFEAIVPCGLAGVEMASIESVGGGSLPLRRVAALCATHFGEVFGREMSRVEPSAILDACRIAS